MVRKRIRCKVGEIVEIPLRNKKYGYALVLRKDKFGLLLVVHKEIFEDSQSIELWEGQEFSQGTIAYVNPASGRQRWRHVGQITEIPDFSQGLTMFYGNSISGWTVVTSDGNQQFFKGSDITYEKLIGRGYLHKILWLGEDIEKFIEFDIPLVWPGKK